MSDDKQPPGGERFIAAVIVAIQLGAPLPITTEDQVRMVGEFLRQRLNLPAVPGPAVVKFMTQIFLTMGQALVTLKGLQGENVRLAEDNARLAEDYAHVAESLALQAHEMFLLKKSNVPARSSTRFECTEQERDVWARENIPEDEFLALCNGLLGSVDEVLTENTGQPSGEGGTK